MKKSIVLLMALVIFALPTIGFAGDRDDPLYNQNLRNTPNFNDDYYDRTYDLNKASPRNSERDYESSMDYVKKYDPDFGNEDSSTNWK